MQYQGATRTIVHILISGPAHLTRSRYRPYVNPVPTLIRGTPRPHGLLALLETMLSSSPSQTTFPIVAGFKPLVCVDCKKHRLVAFSRKGHGLCPSCLGRRTDGRLPESKQGNPHGERP